MPQHALILQQINVKVIKMKIFSTILDYIEKVVKVILFIALAVLCVVAFTEVIRRYLFHKSFRWADEVCRYLLIWITFLGATMLFRRRRLVHFDFGHDKLPPRVLATITLIAHIIGFMMICFIMVRAYKFSFSSVLIRQKSMTMSFLSMSVVYGVVPVSFSLMLLYGIEQFPKLVSDVFKKEDKAVREVWD